MLTTGINGTNKKAIEAQNQERNIFFREIRNEVQRRLGSKKTISVSDLKQIIEDSVSKVESASSLKIIELDKIHKEDFERRVFGWLSSKGIKGLQPDNIQSIVKELFPDSQTTTALTKSRIDVHAGQRLQIIPITKALPRIVEHGPPLTNRTNSDEEYISEELKKRGHDSLKSLITTSGNPSVLIRSGFTFKRNINATNKLEIGNFYKVFQSELTEVGKSKKERSFTAELINIDNTKHGGEVVFLEFKGQSEKVVSSFGDIYLWETESTDQPTVSKENQTIGSENIIICKGEDVLNGNLKLGKIYDVYEGTNTDKPIIKSASLNGMVKYNSGVVFFLDNMNKVINSADFPNGLVFVENTK